MMIKKLKDLKERLQFTGWLQYIATGVVGAIFLILGLIMWVLGIQLLAVPLLIVSLFMYAVVILDIVTIKYKLHFKESTPSSKNDLDMIELILSRRSCRSFQTRVMREEDRTKLMSFVELESKTPRANILEDTGVRFEYIKASLTVWPVVNGSEFLVAIVPKSYHRQAIIDVGYCLQRIVIQATRMGLATCWIGPGADQKSIGEALGDRFDEANDHIVCVCAVGYESKHLPFSIRVMGQIQRRRLPLASLFFQDISFTKPLEIESELKNLSEACRWSPSSFNGQTTRCVGNSEKDIEGDPEFRMDFYATTNSRYYAPVALGIWCANWALGYESLGYRGHFVKNPTLVQGEDSTSVGILPRYDVSWERQNK